ncbi:MAG: hypothetical protein HY783_08130 [Chloroflexi bacterium]|nr:hypothetical protein [Chloroflexota bacterium]
MLILDLQRLLFAFLLVLIAVAALAIWLDRFLRQRQQRQALPGIGGMQSVWERAPFGLLVLEDLRAYRYANPYARRLLGLESPSRLPDADWVRLLDEDRLDARQETGTPGRYRSVPLGVKRFVGWWVTAAGDMDLVFLWDTTAALQAEQATRLLLSDLSHELRTPLATLLTHLEVLRIPQISEETRQQSVHLMQQEAKRMTRLVHNLLELGRLETSAEIERRPVDLRTLVEEALAQVTPQAEDRQIALALQADTPLPPAIGEPDRLTQVFLNLLDNAIKYSRPGDRVTLSLQQDQLRGDIACEIRDTGPGIPIEHLPHITRRFYRAASEAVGGSGLGLALVEEILRHHQSKLEIESHSEGDETGTCVRFVLPSLPETEVDK